MTHDANRQVWEKQTLSGYPMRRVETARDGDGNRGGLWVQNNGQAIYGVYFDYNGRNQLAHIYDGGWSPWFSYSYDASGNLTKRQDLRAGVNDSLNAPSAQYDPLNRPVEWENTGAGDGPFARSWQQYDNVGRMTATWRDEQSGKGECFGYNPTGQLIGAAYNSDQVWTGNPQNVPRIVSYTYTPDTLNRSSVNENWGSIVTNYAPNALNQYQSIAGTIYNYDNNFNLREAPNWGGYFDAQSRLTAAGGGGNVVNFTYDGLGRCVRRVVHPPGGASRTLLFTYDGWKPVMEWDEAGNCQAWNIYGSGPDEILWRCQAGVGNLRYHHDVHGNVAFLLDYNGARLEKYTYDAFGAPTVVSWIAAANTWDETNRRTWSAYGNRFMFQGREYLPELGIYDYRHRMYHPGLGRFMQSDPTGFDAGDMNLFRYVGDDPVDRSDPTGLDPIQVPDDVDYYARSAALKAQELYNRATIAIGMERNIAVFRDSKGHLSLSDPAIGWKDKSSGQLRSAPPDPPRGLTRPASSHNHPNGTRISWQDRVAGDNRGEAVYARGDRTERWRPDEDKTTGLRHQGGVRESWSERAHKWNRETTPQIPANADLSRGGSSADNVDSMATSENGIRSLDTSQLVIDLVNANNSGEGFHPRGPR